MADGSKGMVYLVGAGPGDVGLLTLRGRELLARAEVVVYDRLAPSEMLAFAPPSARLIYVGKSPRHHAMEQDEINALLVREGQAGRTVVRLKGGDPFVFGRGGEEALALRAAGLRFEIVPGVTAGIAGPAYAGIPVTQRGLTSTLALITGHEEPSKTESDVDYKSLAGLGTLVFYMGVKELRRICQGLVAAGKDPATPAAVIERATTSRQRTIAATLATLPERAAAAQVAPPAIIVVGPVVGLRPELAWCEARPLFGRTIVVTRTREQSSDLAAGLRDRGARVLEMPVIAIEPLDPAPLRSAIGRLGEFGWLVFTSPNGVDIFFAELRAGGRDARHLAGCRVAAIGPGTADRLAAHGVAADLMPAEAVAEALAEALVAAGARGATAGTGPGAAADRRAAKVLLPRAAEARDVLPQRLRAAGAEVEEVAAYRTVRPATVDANVMAALASGEVDLVTLTSSSTARNFVELVRQEGGAELLERWRAERRFAAIGPITARTAAELGLHLAVESEVHTIAGLIEAISAWAAPTMATDHGGGSEFAIRPAQPADLPAMQRVIAAGLRSCGYEICGKMDEDFEQLIDYYRSRRGEFFVLESPAAGIVGTVAVMAEAAEVAGIAGAAGVAGVAGVTGAAGSCVMRRMYLDERYRGRGLGRRLLMTAMDWARAAGYRRMELETGRTMTAAMALYRGAGFVLEGETERFGRVGLSFSRDL